MHHPHYGGRPFGDGAASKPMRQILGAVAEFAMTVAKLKRARERVRRSAGKCRGASRMLSVTPACSRRRKSKVAAGVSLRQIAAGLAASG